MASSSISTPRTALLLGAGFSQPFGVPTMARLYQGFIAHVRQVLPSHEEALQDLLEGLPNQADIEALLERLNLACSADDALPSRLRSTDTRRWVEQSQLLRSHLLAYIVDRCERFDPDQVVEKCSTFVRTVSSRNIAVFSTNYDRIIEHACAYTNTSLSDGFAQTSTPPAREWDGSFASGLRLVKLHGSVTWYMQDREDSKAFVSLDRGYALPHPDVGLTMNGSTLQPLMIVPTLEKDALRRPYLDLAMYLGQDISNAKLLIIWGASLRDEHLLSIVDYHAQDLVALVLGRSGQAAAQKLEQQTSIHSIGINADTETMLSIFLDDMEALFGVNPF